MAGKNTRAWSLGWGKGRKKIGIGWREKFTFHIEISWWMFVVAGVLAVGIAFLTISYQSIKAALANPVKSLRSE